MAFQGEQNVTVKYKAQSAFGTIAPAAGAPKKFRLNSGGLGLDRATIESNELRSDLQSTMGRYGSKNVSGGYQADASVGSFDDWIAAVLRGDWVAPLSITFATMTSVTTGANTIVAAAGSWITQGVRVGQVIRPTGLADAANNNRNLRVTGVTALIITVAETLIVNAVADTTGTIEILKRVTQPMVPVRRVYTIEEEQHDIDGSEVFSDARISSLRLAGGPDSMATFDFGVVGADGQVLEGAASPYFTDPATSTTSLGLTLADASIRFAGSDILVASSLDLMIDNRQAGQAVIGGNVTPDIFEGSARVSGSISVIRKDLQNVARFLAETEVELHAMLIEPTAEPKQFISVFAGRIKLGRPTKSYGKGAAMIEVVPFMVGKKEGVVGYDETMVQFETSAAV